MPQEITLHLTPQEAAAGVTRIVNLSSGPITIRIPPVQDGATVRIPTDQGDVLVRVQVTGTYAQTPGFGTTPGAAFAPKKKSSNPAGCLVAFVVVVVGIVIAIAVSNSHNNDDNSTANDNTTTSGYSSSGGDSSTSGDSTSTSGDTSTTGDSSSTSGDSSSTSGDSTSTSGDSSDTSTSGDTSGGDQGQAPIPLPTFDPGTCLDGTIPDSTTAVTVNDVNPVDCSSADAHYKVIQMFPGTTDMDSCNSNPDTQYSFSEDDTLNGVTTNSYVYCLIGLGSYAQQ